MPKKFTYETVIIIDHERNTCRVDTTLRSMRTELRWRGFQEVTLPTSKPYYRFLGKPDQVRLRRPKDQRRMTGVAARVAARLPQNGAKVARKIDDQGAALAMGPGEPRSSILAPADDHGGALQSAIAGSPGRRQGGA